LPRPAIITIDGPVASGKTSLGRMLARWLGYQFLDTGIMYRAITWLALDQGLDLGDQDVLGRLAGECVMQPKGEDGSGVVLDGRELSEELRQPEVDRAVSLVSQAPAVRDALVEQQRRIATEGRIVMVGRDIGTVVLPDAELKIYVTASVRERARRRHMELRQKRTPIPYQQVLQDLEARDGLDTSRSHSPLRAADDAVRLITDGMGPGEVLERVMGLVGRA